MRASEVKLDFGAANSAWFLVQTGFKLESIPIDTCRQLFRSWNWLELARSLCSVDGWELSFAVDWELSSVADWELSSVVDLELVELNRLYVRRLNRITSLAFEDVNRTTSIFNAFGDVHIL